MRLIYPVRITNTGTLADSYTLETTGNTWAMAFPAQVGPLAAGASVDLAVTVTIPPDALGGAADIATLRIISDGKGSELDAVELTTETHWKTVFLPLIRR